MSLTCLDVLLEGLRRPATLPQVAGYWLCSRGAGRRARTLAPEDVTRSWVPAAMSYGGGLVRGKCQERSAVSWAYSCHQGCSEDIFNYAPNGFASDLSGGYPADSGGSAALCCGPATGRRSSRSSPRPPLLGIHRRTGRPADRGRATWPAKSEAPRLRRSWQPPCRSGRPARKASEARLCFPALGDYD